MKKIFALRGIGNSGKSSTLRILAEMLLSKGFKPLQGKNFPGKKLGRTGKPIDFWQIFEADGVRIGITSTGDTYKIVRENLGKLRMHDCKICFCACRTFGGTNAAVEEPVGYSKEYFPKTWDGNELTRKATNEQDALALFNLLESHLTHKN